MNIYLIGYRCTGKTSVGKALANHLGWTFIDADIALVERYGITISEIVSTEGWDSFRNKESTVLKHLSALNDHVVATGGGVILRKENVALLKKSGVVIWLKASKETIKKRMLADEATKAQRPSLTEFDLDKEISETLTMRDPLYTDAMDFSVDTDALSISELCTFIVNELCTRNILTP